MNYDSNDHTFEILFRCPPKRLKLERRLNRNTHRNQNFEKYEM